MEEEKQIETIETFKPNETSDDWSNISGKPKGRLLNQIDEKGVVKNIDANSIRTGVLTGTKIQTSLQGARVVMGGDGDSRNDVVLVDDTTGGTTPVTGNTASIKFTRSDDESQVFRIQKRTGVNSDNENVVEMFFEKDANDSGKNYIFIGRKGDGSDSDVHTDIIITTVRDAIMLKHKNSAENIGGFLLQSTSSAGGNRVEIIASKATSDSGAAGGGAYIGLGIAENESTTATLPFYIDKDGIHLQSANQAGILGVNNSTGALQWNGIDIS